MKASKESFTDQNRLRSMNEFDIYLELTGSMEVYENQTMTFIHTFLRIQINPKVTVELHLLKLKSQQA